MTDPQQLTQISRPGRYLGHEFNTYRKNWAATGAKFVLIFPDLYEIGMSHQGLQILYHILNRTDSALAERCYCPDIDYEKLLAAAGRPLTSLESQQPLANFDVIGFTLPYELCYTNILTVLDRALIPFFAKDRDNSRPLVLGGGACALNPEPVAEFFDAILLGDGEEAIVEIADIVAGKEWHKASRAGQLEMLSTISGVYIPSHFEPCYDNAGKLTGIHPASGKNDSVARRIVADLDTIDHLLQPLVPNAKIIHDRLGIEVARGCTRGCRFCQAGITYRPVRERSVTTIMQLAEQGLDNSGFEELALQSLSTGDYSCINELLPKLMNRYAAEKVSVAMPSMRVGTLTPELMAQIQRVRKTGFTLAPEAGSERLRQVINKGITEEDLLAACSNAYSLGWQLLKLYFMIGLPTETTTDHDELIRLIEKVMATRPDGQRRGKCRINVSVGTFVPKPHTPFQWARQLSVAESKRVIDDLKARLPGKGCNFRYHSPQLSFLEGVFSRGDRKLAQLIAKAWQKGARLDGWDEHFDLSLWRDAAAELGIDLDGYLAERAVDEVLPWHHLHSGVSEAFLQNECHRAAELQYTPDCRYHGCQKCDLCDFKTIYPRVQNQDRHPAKIDSPHPVTSSANTAGEQKGHYRYLVQYSRQGDISFLGHLEMLQLVFRTLRRTRLPLNYTQGFNPTPKVSFSPALAAGTESLAEFFIMDLSAPLGDSKATIKALNDNLVPGLTITKLSQHPAKIPQKLATRYRLTLPRRISDIDRRRLAEFLEKNAYLVEKIRKNKSKQIDIRPIVTDIAVCGPSDIELTLTTAAAQPAVKPIEALTAILNLSANTAAGTKILKVDWHPLK
jgi:radical SAM family uncharacterized protein/radical SAM-linked protein